MDLGKALSLAGRGLKMTRKKWNNDGYLGYEDGLLYVRSNKNPGKVINVDFLWTYENLHAEDYLELKL